MPPAKEEENGGSNKKKNKTRTYPVDVLWEGFSGAVGPLHAGQLLAEEVAQYSEHERREAVAIFRKARRSQNMQ